MASMDRVHRRLQARAWISIQSPTALILNRWAPSRAGIPLVETPRTFCGPVPADLQASLASMRWCRPEIEKREDAPPPELEKVSPSELGLAFCCWRLSLPPFQIPFPELRFLGIRQSALVPTTRQIRSSKPCCPVQVDSRGTFSKQPKPKGWKEVGVWI